MTVTLVVCCFREVCEHTCIMGLKVNMSADNDSGGRKRHDKNRLRRQDVRRKGKQRPKFRHHVRSQNRRKPNNRGYSTFARTTTLENKQHSLNESDTESTERETSGWSYFGKTSSGIPKSSSTLPYAVISENRSNRRAKSSPYGTRNPTNVVRLAKSDVEDKQTRERESKNEFAVVSERTRIMTNRHSGTAAPRAKHLASFRGEGMENTFLSRNRYHRPASYRFHLGDRQSKVEKTDTPVAPRGTSRSSNRARSRPSLQDGVDVTSGMTSSPASSYAAVGEDTIRHFSEQRRQRKAGEKTGRRNKGKRKRGRRRRRRRRNRNRRRGKRRRKMKSVAENQHQRHTNVSYNPNVTRTRSDEHIPSTLSTSDPHENQAVVMPVENRNAIQDGQAVQTKRQTYETDTLRGGNSTQRRKRNNKRRRGRGNKRKQGKRKGRDGKRKGRRKVGKRDRSNTQSRGVVGSLASDQYYEKIQLFGILEARRNDSVGDAAE